MWYQGPFKLKFWNQKVGAHWVWVLGLLDAMPEFCLKLFSRSLGVVFIISEEIRITIELVPKMI